MVLAESKITSQGQISIPAKIRKRLGLAPGSILEWVEQDGEIMVKRAAKYSSVDIHAALFPTPPEAISLEEIDQAIENRMNEKYESH